MLHPLIGVCLRFVIGVGHRRRSRASTYLSICTCTYVKYVEVGQVPPPMPAVLRATRRTALPSGRWMPHEEEGRVQLVAGVRSRVAGR